MDLRLDDQQKLLRDSVRALLQDEYSFAQREKRIADPSAHAARLWHSFAELGWLGVAFPEDLGGFGGTPTEIAVIMEAFGSALVVEPFLSTAVLSGALLAAARREDAIARLIDGELQVALAHEEEGVRGNPADVSTRARVHPEGGFVLDGLKPLVLGAPTAGLFIVSARIAGEQRDPSGIALFLVERDAAGVELEPYRTVDAFEAGSLRLSGVHVRPDAMLAPPGEAFPMLEAAIDLAIVAAGAETVGSAERVLRLTRDYATQRKQFGKTIAEFQAIQHRLADMFVEVERLRGALLDALAGFEQGPAERRMGASALKVQIASAGRFVVSQGIQLHGGIGVTEEYEVGHHFKRLTVIEQLFGTSEYHLGRYAGGMAEPVPHNALATVS